MERNKILWKYSMQRTFLLVLMIYVVILTVAWSISYLVTPYLMKFFGLST